MQYLGGKARISKELGAVIKDHVGDKPIWEPFVGGANMVSVLGTSVATDSHVALISMYQALYAGWEPPDTLSLEEYQQCRELPDTDPLKAFAGFGCSFSGKYFGGYARNNRGDNYARATANALKKLLKQSPHTEWYVGDFCSVSVSDVVEYAVYADPPYAGTTGYSQEINHSAFWAKCQELAAETIVLVSEYTCPVEHTLVWEHTRHLEMRSKQGREARTERLFMVHAK